MRRKSLGDASLLKELIMLLHLLQRQEDNRGKTDIPKMEVYLSIQSILQTCIGLFCKQLKLDLTCIQYIVPNLVKAAKQ